MKEEEGTRDKEREENKRGPFSASCHKACKCPLSIGLQFILHNV